MNRSWIWAKVPGCWRVSNHTVRHENMIDGVVLTFNDITTRIKALASQEALRLAEGIVKTIRQPFIVLDGNLKVISASDTFYRQLKAAEEETIGFPIYALLNHQWDIPYFHKLLESILKSNEPIEKCKITYGAPDSGVRPILVEARRIVGKAGESQMILLSIEFTA